MELVARTQRKSNFFDMHGALLLERCVDDLDLFQHVADLLADAGEVFTAQCLLLDALIFTEAAAAFLAGKLIDAGDEFFRDQIVLSFLFDI